MIDLFEFTQSGRSALPVGAAVPKSTRQVTIGWKQQQVKVGGGAPVKLKS